MLKTVSSITNAIGALNYKGTWNANTNSPAIVSGVGTKGDYYVVSVAGTTTLDGISNWGIGDWAVFNGSVWQRVEGGADLNGVNLSVTGTTTLSGLTASTALALDANKNVVSVTNTGSGSNVLATSPSIATPTLTGDVQMSTGNLVVGTSGKGIDFSATPGTGTSELLDDYEEGTFTARLWDADSGGNSSPTTATGYYTKVGNIVHISIANWNNIDTTGMTAGNLVQIELPFVPERGSAGSIVTDKITYTGGYTSAQAYVSSGSSRAMYITFCASTLSDGTAIVSDFTSGQADIVRLQATYQTAS